MDTMKRAHQAKPTTYATQNFRSRLEARWACFFDLIGWQWTYEPYSINDNYIPDFLIHGGAPFLVEVKPAGNHAELLPVAADLFQRGVFTHTDIEEPDKDLLIVGASPILPDRLEDSPILGLSYRTYPEVGGDITHSPDIALWDTYFQWREFLMSFQHRPSGHHEGDGHLRYNAYPQVIEDLWREAGNRTQWHPAA